MYREIELFGKQVKLKNYTCSNIENTVIPATMQLDLYLKITDICNAKCAVCSNKGNESLENIDLSKLKYVLEYLYNKNVLNRVAITGGEPFLNIQKLNNVVNTIYEANNKAIVSINTNGYRLNEASQLDNIGKVREIHLSRHHYLDKENDEFFKIKTATINDIVKASEKLNKDAIKLNCLIMKQFIYNLKEVKNYLEMASKLGISLVRFLSLMALNDESIKNFIDINEVFKEQDEDMIATEHNYDCKLCECLHGLYCGDNGKLVRYWARKTKEPEFDGYIRQLVYSSDNQLMSGFSGKSLI